VVQPHPLEFAIIRSAQAFVDAWLHDGRRGPFTSSATVAAVQWDDDPAAELEREAFVLVAKAIRAGAGHAAARPEPLLTIVRDALGRRAGPGDNAPPLPI
jgi:hypothetical protein